MTLQRMALLASQPVQVDPLFSAVSLLIRGTGINNSTAIVDFSSTTKTVNVYGNARIVTGVADPFGSTTNGVILLPVAGTSATGAGWLGVNHSSQFNFGSNDFTIELWYQPLALADFSTILTRDAADYPLGMYHGSGVTSGIPAFFAGTTTAWQTQTLSLGAVPFNSWRFLAISRNSGVFRTYNGAPGNSTASLIATDLTWSGAIGDVTSELFIGSNGFPDRRTLQAYLSNIRITTGAGRYPSFCPVPTASFPTS